MYLIAGLGNPGAKYEGTRHNIGFIFLDYLAREQGLTFGASKWQAEVAQGICCGRKVILVKPTTFMNLSGTALGQIASYYKIDLDEIMVIHDDLDLPLGRLKMVRKRGAGGHNGISSIISHLGSNDFNRVRLGVGRPTVPGMEVSSFVLGRFSPEELERVGGLFTDLERGVCRFVEEGGVKAMNFLNALRP